MAVVERDERPNRSLEIAASRVPVWIGIFGPVPAAVI
jgi:hypothetical protein